MTILYIGDIVGQAGLKTIELFLPSLRDKHQPDLIVAQGENVTDGRGISRADLRQLLDLGVDFVTGGNWTTYRPEMISALASRNQPIIGPANFTPQAGPGHKIYTTSNNQRVLLISLLGQVVGRQLPAITNPLLTVDKILANYQSDKLAAIVVNFHGDFSSEKRTIGYYLDGRVTLVVGDHWHIQTNDAMILPKGTAHITDVGMVGSLNSSLGVDLDSVIPRWRDSKVTTNQIDNRRPWQLNAVFVKCRNQSAEQIETIRLVKD